MLSCTRAISSGLSNWARNAPVDAGVVSVPSAGLRSSTTTRSPARDAKKAVATPTTPPPITTRSALRGRSVVVGTGYTVLLHQPLLHRLAVHHAYAHIADDAVFIDEEAGWDGEDVVEGGDAALYVGKEGEGHAELGGECAYGLAVALGRHAQYLEVVGGVLVSVQLDDLRYLCAARRAPGRPEVDHHGPPTQTAQFYLLPVNSLEAEIRGFRPHAWGRTGSGGLEAVDPCSLGQLRLPFVAQGLPLLLGRPGLHDLRFTLAVQQHVGDVPSHVVQGQVVAGEELGELLFGCILRA